MSGETLTEVDVYTIDVWVPKPGEDVTASSVRIFAQALANRTRRMNLHGALDTTAAVGGANSQDFTFAGTIKISGGSSKLRVERLTELLGNVVLDGGVILKTGRSFSLEADASIVVPSVAAIFAEDDDVIQIGAPNGVYRTRVAKGRWQYNPSEFSEDASGGIVSLQGGTGGTLVTTAHATFIFDGGIPHHAKMIDVWVWLQGGGGPGGTVPAQFPTMQYTYENITTGVVTTLTPVTDPSTTNTQYGNYHTIHKGTLNHTWDASKFRLAIKFTSETGTGCNAGLRVSGIQIGYNQNRMDT